MSRALRSGAEKVKAYIKDSQARIDKLLHGEGVPGHRAFPARGGNMDKKLGVRIDYGEKFELAGVEYQRFMLQANKGSDDKTLKEMANKDSHKVWSHADIPVRKVPKEEEDDAVDDFFDQIDKNMKK